MTVKYRKNDDTWADITATDGTASGGATLAATADITWTAPTDWKQTTLGGGDAIVTDADAPGTRGFWLQVSWSIALDAATSLTELWSINKDTRRGYFRLGTEYVFSLDRTIIGAFESVVASGTDTLEVTHVRTMA